LSLTQFVEWCSPSTSFANLPNGSKQVSSSALGDRKYLTRSELAVFLTARGYGVSLSTLDKLAMPSRGEGPAPVGTWSGRAYYDPVTALAWARNRFRTTELTRGRRGAGRKGHLRHRR
jgi:hypothetical protein